MNMNIQPCEVNAARVMVYLDSPASNPDLPAHVAECRYCQVRLLAMGAAASTRGAKRRDCDAAKEQLPGFIEVEASGAPLTDDYAPLTVHLVLCANCFALYQELRLMDELVINNALPTPPRSAYRPPDLSFLHGPQWGPVEIGGRMLRSLRISLALLFQPPELAPAPVRQKRTIEIEGRKAVDLTEVSLGVEQLGELDVDVKLYQGLRQPSQARLEVYARTYLFSVR